VLVERQDVIGVEVELGPVEQAAAGQLLDPRGTLGGRDLRRRQASQPRRWREPGECLAGGVGDVESNGDVLSLAQARRAGMSSERSDRELDGDALLDRAAHDSGRGGGGGGSLGGRRPPSPRPAAGARGGPPRRRRYA